MKESQIQSAIIDYLQVLENQGKVFFQRMNTTGLYNPTTKGFMRMPKGVKKGMPDILVIQGGQVIGLEVKTETGRQSKEQRIMERRFKDNGAEYHIVRSADDVIDLLG